MEKIVVEPLPQGWSVKTDAVDNLMVFRTGSAAEEAARALAYRLAKAGEPVRLDLKLRGSNRTAKFVCLPALDPDSPPHLIDLPTVRTPNEDLAVPS